MAYRVGISTGFWKVGRDPALLGLAQKIGGLGATGGITFVQIDLETVAEFYEPELKDQINRMRDKLGMIAGLHGEIGPLMALDAAEKRIWDQTHLRLCQTVKFAAELGFFFVNVHFSNKQLLAFEEAQQRQGVFYPVLGPYGKSLQTIAMRNKGAEAEAKQHIDSRYLQESPTFEREVKRVEDEHMKDFEDRVEKALQRHLRQLPKKPTESEKEGLRQEIRERMKQVISSEIREEIQSTRFQFNVWLKLGPTEFIRYLLSDGEVGAYFIVAAWMHENKDPLWEKIAGGKNPGELYFSGKEEDILAFHAAVAAKYIEGHLTLKDHPANEKYLGGMSVKEWCEKRKLYFLMENPESGEGAEGLFRLFHPQHFYHLIKQLNSSHIKVTIDFEHLVSQKLNPDEVFPDLPGDFGKMVYLFHIGQPVPYGGTAHIPLSRGTLAQEQIYRWLHIMRKKGWKEGYMMFERGAGRSGGGKLPAEVFEDSVAALRQIAKYLDQNIKPSDLPPEFYGISSDNRGIFTRQRVIIRDHARDPLEGVLGIPEEKHTFLSGAAVAKQKAQEWEKRKYR